MVEPGEPAFGRPRQAWGKKRGGAERRRFGGRGGRAHLVVVQLLFGEDGLLVPHCGRGAVARPLGCRLPSAAAGAPSPRPSPALRPAASDGRRPRSPAQPCRPALPRPAAHPEGAGRGPGRRGTDSEQRRLRPTAGRGRALGSQLQGAAGPPGGALAREALFGQSGAGTGVCWADPGTSGLPQPGWRGGEGSGPEQIHLRGVVGASGVILAPLDLERGTSARSRGRALDRGSSWCPALPASHRGTLGWAPSLGGQAVGSVEMTLKAPAGQAPGKLIWPPPSNILCFLKKN